MQQFLNFKIKFVLIL